MSTESRRRGRHCRWFLWALTAVFVGLKLSGYVGWSWLWVLAPLWVPTVCLVVVALMILIQAIDRSLDP